MARLSFFYLIKNRIKRSSILKDMNFLSLGIFYEILRIFKNLKTFLGLQGHVNNATQGRIIGHHDVT